MSVAVFTHARMLEIWRLRAGLGPVPEPGVCELLHGVPINEILIQRMRSWYLDLLDRGDIRHLAPTDIAPMIDLQPSHCSPAVGEAMLPAGCRRLLSFRLASWQQGARIVTRDTHPDLARLLAAPDVATRLLRPVVLVEPSGRIFVHNLHPDPTLNTVVEASAAYDEGDETYTLDESALQTIPTFKW